MERYIYILFHQTKVLGLIDYLKYVQKPMDLNTISKNIRDENYRTVENVLDDIQLIFDNCKVYNTSGSVIFSLITLIFSGYII